MLAKTLTKTITEIKKTDLDGCKKIAKYSFYECTKLKSIEIPYSVKRIEGSSFADCTALTDINTDEMDPHCKITTASDIAYAPFRNTGVHNNLPADTIWLMAKGKIMAGNTCITSSGSLVIPDSVINLASNACSGANDNFTSFVIPDTVEIICDDVITSTGLTKLTVGKSVRDIGTSLIPSGIVTLIFRQPAGMEIELPTAGDGTGMAYNKDSRAVSIYTDNEYIKNYDWATDNVTATFYPLSDAPK